MIERISRGGIETVRMNDGKVNAFDFELANELEAVFREIAEDESDAVILTGSGRTFSAGVDLFRVLEEGPDYTARFIRALDSMFRTVFEFPKPLVTAVNGHAIAGGCLLAISGDVRIMAEGNGRIGVPELMVGVPFPVYALEMVSLTLKGRALDQFLYTGTLAVPVVARDAGLVDRIVAIDDLESTAMEEAVRLAAIAPAAFRRTKLQLRSRASRAVEALGSDPDRETVEIWSSAPTRSSIRSYLERTIRK